MKLILIMLSGILFGLLATACDADAVAPTSTAPVPITIASASPPGGPDLFRAKATAYWDAFNLYDLETVSSFYQPAYLQEEEENLRRDIGLLQQFGITLGMEEQAAPARNDDGRWEMLMLMEEPTGLRTIRMAWIDWRGEWLLSAVTEVTE